MIWITATAAGAASIAGSRCQIGPFDEVISLFVVVTVVFVRCADGRVLTKPVVRRLFKTKTRVSTPVQSTRQCRLGTESAPH